MIQIPVNITLFCCSNSVQQNELSEINREIEGVNFKTIGLPCSGKVDLMYLLKAIETGSDGVILITCTTGKCHYLAGNLRAQKRVDALNSLLQETGLETNRIKLIQPIATAKPGYILNEIKNYCNTLKSLTKSGTVTV